jgi:hypothetical protein
MLSHTHALDGKANFIINHIASLVAEYFYFLIALFSGFSELINVNERVKQMYG